MYVLNMLGVCVIVALIAGSNSIFICFQSIRNYLRHFRPLEIVKIILPPPSPAHLKHT